MVCVISKDTTIAINVLEKIILELKPRSRELAAEIDERETKVNGTNAQIVFKNGSYIKVVTASDSARGNVLPSKLATVWLYAARNLES